MSARRLERFSASVLFAALAALCWPAVALALGPWLGAAWAFRLYAAGCALAYLLRFGRPRLRALARRPLRAAAVELALATLGLALARAAGGDGLTGSALAVWAFGLVESAWFLGGAAPAPDEPAPDPFDEALRRARSVLEGEP
jgi:hypothetical protein